VTNLLETLKLIGVDEVTFHPQNYNEHPDAQVDTLEKSLEKFNQYKNLVVWRDPDDGVLYCIAGHGMLLAAKQKGDTKIVVSDQSHLSREEAEDLMITDNLSPSRKFDNETLAALLGDRDDPTEIPGIDDEVLADLLAGIEEELPPAPEPQISRADELQEKWKVKTGDLWEIGRHKLICGDCTDAAVVAQLGKLPCNLFYDPSWDGGFQVPEGKWESTLAFCDGFRAGTIIDLLGSPAWVFIWDCVTSWYTPNRPLRRGKLALWYGNLTDYNFNGAHYGEPLEAHTVRNTRGEYDFVPDQRGKHLSDVFQMGITQIHKSHKHEKPFDWVRLLVGNCLIGDVYDPFAGSGTTGIACERLGRKSRMIEIEPKYCAVILQRFADMGLVPSLIKDASGNRVGGNVAITTQRDEV